MTGRAHKTEDAPRARGAVAGEGSQPSRAPQQGSAPFDAQSVFDVCHAGLVLRAVLGVQLMLGLGMALAARDLVQWMAWVSSGTVVSLSGVLLWLLLICALQRQLARWRERWQWGLALLLGAMCASLGWQLLSLASGEASSAFRLLSVALAGLVSAAMLLYWLKQRQRAQRPADDLARLVELQARIRPHFLFNTLNTAIALVRIDPQRAEGVLEDLSELFRAALAETDAVVSLDAEVELARRYLDIEQIRHGARLRVSWQLDPAAGSARVPPLLLQPLVENAVRHGVEPNEQGGEVEIRTRARGSEVEILVRNTVQAPARQPGHGLALRNLRERLRLMHDVAARFELSPEAGRFTVRIILPR
ncbi:histidine kinase [Kinneretia asaccharophila]|uniref:Two-component system sensor histidine kinase AlgZ n=1 Tax=Roseateles asaccharophilus TaxID=582607 RepID=A0A4R6MYZ1_9BURK|nr:histidine kinase [Roseateles asaccharophilus]MDN3545477.1 histidine kinase [Roseateles asaccharophilus]TDP07857.1 two-component system sensor histidine kinase AlgZ [Roseateles asaccharophilus]